MNNKIYQSSELLILELEKAKKIKNLKIGLCHGCFDLVHPGHLMHFQDARKKCDILIVSITADAFIEKGFGRPLFKENTRLNSLAAIECVDYVLLASCKTGLPVIKQIKPDIYFKGSDYSNLDDDPSGQILEEVKAVKEVGGIFEVTKTEKFSSTEIINNFFEESTWGDNLSFINKLKSSLKYDDIKNILDSDIAKQEIVVIGDIIIDEYVYTQPLGTTTKSPVISALYQNHEVMAGGSLAVARHLATFFKTVHFVGIKGMKNWTYSDTLKKTLPKNIKLHLIKSPGYTPHKKKYVSSNYPSSIEKTESNVSFSQKLFAVSWLDQGSKFGIDSELEKIIDLIKTSKSKSVIVCDFGHGAVNNKLWKGLRKLKINMIVNIQTNSSNFGFNLASKYSNADYLCIDELETSLVINEDIESKRSVSRELMKATNAKNVIITCGKKGHYFNVSNKFDEAPSFAKNIIDPVGAGDAVLASIGLLSSIQTKPINLELFKLFPLAFGSLACEIIGNKHSIQKSKFLKYIKPFVS